MACTFFHKPNLLRLGGTSCIVPGDLLENVRFQAPFTDDVELIYYLEDDKPNLGDKKLTALLNEQAKLHNLSYTVHLPSHLGSIKVSPKWIQDTVDNITKCLEVSLPLNPFAYVWHWEAEQFGLVPTDNIPLWLDGLREIAQRVNEKNLVSPKMLCVETLSYDFGLIFPMVKEMGFSVTLDIGHIWRAALDAKHWKYLLPYTKVVHIHGIDKNTNRDHLALDLQNFDSVKEFSKALSEQLQKDKMERTVTLEVFSPQDLHKSMKYFGESF